MVLYVFFGILNSYIINFSKQNNFLNRLNYAGLNNYRKFEQQLNQQNDPNCMASKMILYCFFGME